MGERESLSSRPQALVVSMLGERSQLRKLMYKRDREPLLKSVRSELQDYSPNEITELTYILIAGIGTDSPHWDWDRRDGAMHILGIVPLNKEGVKPENLLEIYLGALRNQGESHGSIRSAYSLAEAENILTPYFPIDEETTAVVDMVWDDIADKFQHHPGWETVRRKRHGVKRGSPSEKSKTLDKPVEYTGVIYVFDKPEEPKQLKKIKKSIPLYKQITKLPDLDDVAWQKLTERQKQVVTLYVEKRHPGRGVILEIAEELGINSSTVRDILTVAAGRLFNPEISNPTTDAERVRRRMVDSRQKQIDFFNTISYGLESLSERERRVVELYYRDGKKLTEIGEILGLSNKAVSKIKINAVESLGVFPH